MTTPSIDPVWVGIKWVVKHTGHSRWTINRWAKAGKIPAHRRKGARHWRFESSKVKVWWAAAYNGAPNPEEKGSK
ncbi:MAG: excisionase family DNA-binding protein [Verrucomicrobium sp.]|nr:excisionase family DNA-binding protein [Verrucomicrobium sp.]